MILEYMLNRMEDGRLTTPMWVQDGGYVPRASNATYMGFSPSLANREYYVPDSVTVMTADDAKTRALARHAEVPFTNDDGSEMTEQEVNDWVDQIISDHDLA